MQTGCTEARLEVRVDRDGGGPRDFVGSPPPDLTRIVERARVLTAVAYRGWSEVRERSAARRQTTAQRLVAWLAGDGVPPALEPDEARVLNAASDDLDEPAWMAAAWRIEGAGVLAWAARSFRLPGGGELVKLPELMDAVELLPREASTVRPRDEREVLALMRQCMDVLDANELDFDNHGNDASLIARAAFERAKATRWLMGLVPTYAECWVPLRRSNRRLV